MIERLTCPLTGRPAEVVFSRPYRHSALWEYARRARLETELAERPYEIRFSPACGLYFQTWTMSDAELGNWYSPAADLAYFHAEIGRQKLHWWAHQTEEILVLRQLTSASMPRVLDFGCNWGKWASMALAFGCEVFAVEVNCDAAAFCSARGIQMLRADQLPAEHFDFINVDQVMEHLTDPRAIARRLAAALKPGGWIKLSTPNNRQLPKQLRRAQATGEDAVLDPKTLDSLEPIQHVNLFDPESLRVLARDAGLQPYRLPFFKWLGAGQLWNVPRQFNRNLVVPWKRWRGNTTYQWFQKPGG